MNSNELDKYEEEAPNPIVETDDHKFKHLIIVLAIALLSFGIIELVILDGANASIFFKNRPSQIALEYYLETYENGVNTKGIYAMTRRLGCHDEIVIYNNQDEPLTKYQYSNGRVYESNTSKPADF